jgi:hypothetical protein
MERGVVILGSPPGHLAPSHRHYGICWHKYLISKPEAVMAHDGGSQCNGEAKVSCEMEASYLNRLITWHVTSRVQTYAFKIIAAYSVLWY